VTTVALPDGGRLAIAIEGDGPALLLLRPLGGSLASWGPFAAALAPHVRVVMFDPRGVGCSSPAPIPTTTAGMAADAVALLDALGLARVHVYGLSLGGRVACRLALAARERVDRLVLASTPVRGRALRIDGLADAFALARCLVASSESAEACLASRVLSRRYRETHPDEVARIQARARARPSSHRGRLTLLAAALLHDVAGEIGAVASETLLVRGGADALVAPDAYDELARLLPRARAAVVPDAGHDVSAEAPETVARLVLAHLQPPRPDERRARR
jgi:pimeloyl-ACP methyl ester carboxylesterase